MGFRSSASYVDDVVSSTSQTANAPAGVQAHDRLYAIVTQDGTGTTWTPPSGWTSIGRADIAFDSQHVELFEKLDATGSDSYTWTLSATGNPLAIQTFAFSGMDNSTAATVVSTVNSSGFITPVSATYTGVTATAGASILAVFANDANNQFDAWTYSTPTGFTAAGTTSPQWSTVAGFIEDGVSAGATGSLATTITDPTTGTAQTGYSGFVVNIPVAAGPTTLTNNGGIAYGAISGGAIGDSPPLPSGNPSLTGQAVVAAQGTLAPVVTVALTGVAAVAAQGTVTVASTDVTVAATGAAAVAARGTLVPTTSVPLTGVAGVAAQGSVAPVVAVPLTGVAGVAAQGSLTPATSVPLSGQAAVAAQGSLAASVTVALTGVGAATGQGSLTPSLSAPLTGQAAVAAQGTLAPVTSVPLTGNAVGMAVGTMSVAGSPDVTIALTGVAISAGQGNLTPAVSVPLTGTAAATGQGSLAPALTYGLTGQAVVAGRGGLTPSTTVALAGTAASMAVGAMTVAGSPDVTVALTGVGVVAGTGALTAVPQPSSGKSHTQLYIQQMLVDYYTQAFEKKFEEPAKPDVATPASAKKRKVLSLKKAPAPERVAEAVAKAQPTLQNVPEIVVADLITSALKFNALVFDFQAFGAEQRRRRQQREDEEILLFVSIL